MTKVSNKSGSVVPSVSATLCCNNAVSSAGGMFLQDNRMLLGTPFRKLLVLRTCCAAAHLLCWRKNSDGRCSPPLHPAEPMNWLAGALLRPDLHLAVKEMEVRADCEHLRVCTV
jgi:hypothetical protein